MKPSDQMPSERIVWEMLSTRKGVGRLIEDLPEDSRIAVTAIATRMNEAFSLIERLAFDGLDSIPLDKTPEEQREYIYELPCFPVIFAMRDGEDYAQIIWEMIEPGKVSDEMKYLSEAVERRRLVKRMDGYRWPEIDEFLSNVERSGWLASS